MSAEGIRLGPPPWLGQLRSRIGRREGARGGPGQRLGGAAAGQEAHLDFCSLVVALEAFPASVKCGALALCLAWPLRAQWAGPPAHLSFQALQRKANESLGVVDGVVLLQSLSTVSTPLACPERPTEGAQGTLAGLLFPWTCVQVCVTLLQLSGLSPLASQKE